jgi:hypothetical protein
MFTYTMSGSNSESNMNWKWDDKKYIYMCDVNLSYWHELIVSCL